MDFNVGSFCKIAGRSTYKGGCLKNTYCVVCKRCEGYLGVYPLDGRLNAASLDGTYWPPNQDVINCSIEEALRETIGQGIRAGQCHNDAWNQLSDVLEKFVAKGVLTDVVMKVLDSITEDRVKNGSPYWAEDMPKLSFAKNPPAKKMSVNTNNINTQLGGNDMNKFENLINKVHKDDLKMLRDRHRSERGYAIRNDARVCTLHTLQVDPNTLVRLESTFLDSVESTDPLADKLKALKAASDAGIAALDDFYQEVQTNMDAVDNYEQGVKLLQSYGILDSDGTVAPFANRKFNKEDK